MSDKATERPQRIPPVDIPEPASPLLRAIANNERMLEYFRVKTDIIVRNSGLPERARWLITMRMSWRCKCDYEFGRHAKSAATPELLDVAVGPVDAPGLSDSDRLLLKLVDELYEQHDLTDQTFEALSREWTPGEMIELVTVAGGYWQAAAVANVARVKDTAHAGA